MPLEGEVYITGGTAMTTEMKQRIKILETELEQLKGYL
jgi:hypothetical protein